MKPALTVAKETIMATRTYHPEAFPKTCSCGRVYDRAAWVSLVSPGVMLGVMDGKRFYDDLEMRHCSCKSTMSVKIR